MKERILLFIICILNGSCHANQNDQSMNSDQMQNIDRPPVVAGMFYDSNPDVLKKQIKGFFLNASDESKSKEICAVIVPHAGYVYSGEVAAHSFSVLDPEKHYENVFIIASSHRAYYKGASIYNQGDYITPLGKVKVNKDIANELIENHSFFTYNKMAHNEEHSIEVQLPFLQYLYDDNLQIIPIVIGGSDKNSAKQIANALQPYFNNNNLFVISSDFSHYPNYEDANKYDIETANAIVSNTPDVFLKTINDHEKKNIPNLSTSACGWMSILTLMYLTEKDDSYKYNHLIYKNSGEYAYKDKSRVVGYNAISVSRVENKSTKKEDKSAEKGFSISKDNQKLLLKIARETIEGYLKDGKIPGISKGDINDEISTQSGAFVTLHKNGDLRGCIGRFTSEEPLFAVVQRMAIAAATEDYRFSNVESSEMKEIDIEISVLSSLKKIESIDEIELGKHGIYIIKGYNRGTFLPQVATETGWDLEEFLGHCARDKARIGWDGWKDAEIYTYEAFVFSEHKLK